MKRQGRPPSDPVARFWSYVDRAATPNACWPWIGCLGPDGYGAFGWRGRTVGAHRAGYEFQIGAIPAGLNICHHCDNRQCVRGDHLFAGTQNDNIQDAKRKGRIGAPLATPETIRTLRSAGMLHREIALHLGITRQRVGQILAGRRSRPAPPSGEGESE